jgi:hypothetical protein
MSKLAQNSFLTNWATLLYSQELIDEFIEVPTTEFRRYLALTIYKSLLLAMSDMAIFIEFQHRYCFVVTKRIISFLLWQGRECFTSYTGAKIFLFLHVSARQRFLDPRIPHLSGTTGNKGFAKYGRRICPKFIWNSNRF